MPSNLSGYEYDIFISYRQNDNKRDGWVTEFVNALKDELDATFKEKVHIYFDENPTDGLQESHDVDRSLEKKLKCVLFIPIISLTYCDINCFAWQQELIPFINNAANDAIGMNIQLANGNVASRILPIKIHDIDASDEDLLQEKTGSVIRSIDFIYRGAGVNRPLRLNETSSADNARNLIYRNQLNKVAMAIKDRLKGAIEVDNSDEIKDELSNEDTTSVSNESFGEKVIKRDLMKVGLVYAIISLVLWKVINLGITYFSLPDYWSEIGIIALVAMLPVALLLAWLFEKGPSGFIMTNSLAAKNNPFSGKQKKPLTGNTAFLSLIVIMLVLYFVPQTILPNIASSSANLLKNKSIAVLYFDNMSGDPAQEYFSDGITEEIIARLAQVEGLRVISRTSTHAYKGKARNLKKIAGELNVAVVLEGSVRKEGNKIRITAQLIDAETDEHIWVETYTRESNEIFKVQSEIAHELAKKFEVDVTPEMDLKINKIPTNNFEAYEYYLRGRHIAFNDYYYKFDSIDFIRSKNMYEKAILIDSSFAEAYAGLADLYDAYRQDDNSFFTKELDSIRHALSLKAYRLDPNSAFVNNVRIWMLLNRDEPLEDSAFYHVKKALLLDLNDYYNYQTVGDFLVRHGLHGLASPFYEKSIELNPLDPESHAVLGLCYWIIGDIDDAEKNFNKAFELEQYDNYVNSWITVFWYLNNGDSTKSMSLIKNLNIRNRMISVWLKIADRNFKEAEIIADSMVFWWFKAEAYVKLDKRIKAIEAIPLDAEETPNSYLWYVNATQWELYHTEPKFRAKINARKKIYEQNKIKYGLTLSDFNIKE